MSVTLLQKKNTTVQWETIKPLSVILILILYNKLCRTIKVHRGSKFFSYADYFTILKKCNNNVNTMSTNSLFKDMLSWCDYS